MTRPFAGAYVGKKVFLTGHTGFKGAWMTEWLCHLGAEVVGYSHEVPSDDCLFEALGHSKRITHIIGDVRDSETLHRSIDAAKPDFVFHLAAQALVRYSYDNPVETFATNVMGTVNVLEVLRQLDRPTSCVVVTSDKCYENRGILMGYREDDPMGGKDPYSASKGAAEIVSHSYLRSFFANPDSVVRVGTARAGNVIGGGDWAADRIVPDCIRCLRAGAPIPVRNPHATRPWQHVLEALSGYLWLGALLSGQAHTRRVLEPADVFEGFNFGPWTNSNLTVGHLVDELLKHWPGHWEDTGSEETMPEAGLLGLSIDKAYHKLQWQPTFDFSENVERTILWYRRVHDESTTAAEQTLLDISHYEQASRDRSIEWAIQTEHFKENAT